MKVLGEASSPAAVTVDLKRARRYDEVARAYGKNNSQLVVAALLFLAVAAVLILLLEWYLWGGVAAAIGLLLMVARVRKSGYSDEFLKSIYTDGLLIPAVVRKTQPLTILALGPLGRTEQAPERWGCREFALQNLPGHKPEPGERVPCASLYYTGAEGEYWQHFEVHPLCWATESMEEIRQKEAEIDAADWEALDRLTKTLPDQDLDLLHILDEGYQLIASRPYNRDWEEADPNREL